MKAEKVRVRSSHVEIVDQHHQKHSIVIDETVERILDQIEENHHSILKWTHFSKIGFILMLSIVALGVVFPYFFGIGNVAFEFFQLLGMGMSILGGVGAILSGGASLFLKKKVQNLPEWEEVLIRAKNLAQEPVFNFSLSRENSELKTADIPVTLFENLTAEEPALSSDPNLEEIVFEQLTSEEPNLEGQASFEERSAIVFEELTPSSEAESRGTVSGETLDGSIVSGDLEEVVFEELTASPAVESALEDLRSVRSQLLESQGIFSGAKPDGSIVSDDSKEPVFEDLVMVKEKKKY